MDILIKLLSNYKVREIILVSLLLYTNFIADKKVILFSVISIILLMFCILFYYISYLNKIMESVIDEIIHKHLSEVDGLSDKIIKELESKLKMNATIVYNRFINWADINKNER